MGLGCCPYGTRTNPWLSEVQKRLDGRGECSAATAAAAHQEPEQAPGPKLLPHSGNRGVGRRLHNICFNQILGPFKGKAEEWCKHVGVFFGESNQRQYHHFGGSPQKTYLWIGSTLVGRGGNSHSGKLFPELTDLRVKLGRQEGLLLRRSLRSSLGVIVSCPHFALEDAPPHENAIAGGVDTWNAVSGFTPPSLRKTRKTASIM